MATDSDDLQCVELLQAFSWCCDACGRDNFERAVSVEFGEDEWAEFKLEHGIDESASGMFVRMPEQVVCRHCQAKYKTA